MDVDKVILILKTFGFPAAIAVWFLWRIDGFFISMIESNTKIIALLEQLIKVH